jgi:hypothetical protein
MGRFIWACLFSFGFLIHPRIARGVSSGDMMSPVGMMGIGAILDNEE